MGNRAYINGLGSYLPQGVLSNVELEKMVETSDEWIVTRTGISERRIAHIDEHASTMGIEAAQRALADAGCFVGDIECIIVATMTPDYLVPGTAPLIQSALGVKDVPAFDIQAACSGFLYALSIAKSFVESDTYSTVLLVAPEKMSSIVDYEDRSTCIIFGDGASAAVISSKEEGLRIRNICLGTDGERIDLLTIPAGGCRLPSSQETCDARKQYIQMNGRETFKHAVRSMERSARQCLALSSLEETDIKWLVPHQANIRIIEALGKRFAIAEDHVFTTIQRYGNTSASSIGIALQELLSTNDLQCDENILLTAFGAGLSWGSGVVTMVKE